MHVFTVTLDLLLINQVCNYKYALIFLGSFAILDWRYYWARCNVFWDCLQFKAYM